MHVCLQGSSALDNGKYWQTTQSWSCCCCCPSRTTVSEHKSGPVDPAHDTGSANDSEPFCCDAFSSEVIESPVAKYSCWNKLKSNCFSITLIPYKANYDQIRPLTFGYIHHHHSICNTKLFNIKNVCNLCSIVLQQGLIIEMQLQC